MPALPSGCLGGGGKGEITKNRINGLDILRLSGQLIFQRAITGIPTFLNNGLHIAPSKLQIAFGMLLQQRGIIQNWTIPYW